MSLPTARKDSNAPSPGGETKASTGELGMVGFTHVEYEKFRPARLNTDIGSTEDSIGGEVLGQDGTNMDAYQYQPDTIDSDDPTELKVAAKGQPGKVGPSLSRPGKGETKDE